LTKVEYIFHEEPMTISDGIGDMASAACFDNGPSITSIGTSVPEQHASMTPALKHLQPHESPTCAKMPSSFTVAPAVQAIVVDCVPIVEPQLASIIGDNAEMVMACPEKSHSPCPAHGKVIASAVTRPSASSVTIIYIVSPASQVRFATVQILAPATLTKVESIFHE
jgi:hypothetical protein